MRREEDGVVEESVRLGKELVYELEQDCGAGLAEGDQRRAGLSAEEDVVR